MLGNSKGIQATINHFSKYQLNTQTASIREAIASETETFVCLAGNNEALLETKLHQLKHHNALLRKRMKSKPSTSDDTPSKPCTPASDAPGRGSITKATTSTRELRPRVDKVARWLSPTDSEYDSDSTTASCRISSKPQKFGRKLFQMSLSQEQNKTLVDAREVMNFLLPEGSKEPARCIDPIVAQKIIAALELLRSHIQEH